MTKPISSWTKAHGRLKFREHYDRIKEHQMPSSITISLTPREIQMVLSSINVHLYKLDKEDKPFLPKEGRKNANHVRQETLVNVAKLIKESIDNGNSNTDTNSTAANTESNET